MSGPGHAGGPSAVPGWAGVRPAGLGITPRDPRPAGAGGLDWWPGGFRRWRARCPPSAAYGAGEASGMGVFVAGGVFAAPGVLVADGVFVALLPRTRNEMLTHSERTSSTPSARARRL